VSYDGLYGSKLHLQTLDEAMHADWEVDVIEVSSTTLILRGYLVREEEVRTWSRVDTFAAEGLDGQCGGLLYDLDEHGGDGSWCIPLRSHGLSVEQDSVGNAPWLVGSYAGLGHIKHPLAEMWVIISSIQ